jgi:cytochrome P450
MAAEAVASIGPGGGDLAAVGPTVATQLICRLLGVPDSDVGVFTQWADDLSPSS